MEKVPASKFARRFGEFRDQAQREPIAVTVHERVAGYFVSKHDFEEFQRLQAESRRALAVRNLDEETIDLIIHSKMDKRHDHLNALLED